MEVKTFCMSTIRRAVVIVRWWRVWPLWMSVSTIGTGGAGTTTVLWRNEEAACRWRHKASSPGQAKPKVRRHEVNIYTDERRNWGSRCVCILAMWEVQSFHIALPSIGLGQHSRLSGKEIAVVWKPHLYQNIPPQRFSDEQETQSGVHMSTWVRVICRGIRRDNNLQIGSLYDRVTYTTILGIVTI